MIVDFTRDKHPLDLNVTELAQETVPPNADNDQRAVQPYAFKVLTPAEITELTNDILADLENSQIPQANFLQLTHHISEFRAQWASTFSRFGQQRRGELAYQDLILSFNEQIATKANKWLRHSEGKGKYAISVITSMLSPSRPSRKRVNLRLLKNRRRKAKLMKREFECPTFERPLFIVSTPRAGSTLLFETLSQFPNLWTIGEESHETIEGIAELHPAARNFASNRLTEADASPQIAHRLRKRFAAQLEDRQKRIYLDLPLEERPSMVRFLEKTPKNALRIPFLKALFPDARFIYLYREPKSNISSMLEGWRMRRFIAYDPLPSWPYRTWCFLLIPGWQSLHTRPLVEIVAHQWQVTNRYILDDLQALPHSDWCLVDYADLIDKPKEVMHKIAQFADLQWDDVIEQVTSRSLPVSSMTFSAPSPDKWRKHASELATVLPLVEPIVSQ